MSIPASIVYQVSADELRAIVKEMYHEARQEMEQAIKEHRERPTIDRRQASQLLNVSFSTLWKWAKIGYLTPSKIGAKVLYRASDIDRILEKEKGGAA